MLNKFKYNQLINKFCKSKITIAKIKEQTFF